jgi:hypothetical protein
MCIVANGYSNGVLWPLCLETAPTTSSRHGQMAAALPWMGWDDGQPQTCVEFIHCEGLSTRSGEIKAWLTYGYHRRTATV